MENQVRIFRKNPIAWWDKNVMRHLRHKYGKDKKTFLLVRSVYLALCEIESDFNDKPVNFFTKTVGTYAGLSREAAGKYINLLVKEGLIKKTRIVDQTTKTYSSGTAVELLGMENAQPEAIEPVSAYPDTGVSQHWGTRATNKNISIDKKINNNVNVDLKMEDAKSLKITSSIGDVLTGYKRLKMDKHPKPLGISQRDYLAQEMMEKLSDEKSLGCFRKIAAKIPEEIIFSVLANVKDSARSGKIRQSRGALFVDIIKKYALERNIDLGFKHLSVPE